jgi:hypothetical protein
MFSAFSGHPDLFDPLLVNREARMPFGRQESFRAENIPDTCRPGYDGLKEDSP